MLPILSDMGAQYNKGFHGIVLFLIQAYIKSCYSSIGFIERRATQDFKVRRFRTYRGAEDQTSIGSPMVFMSMRPTSLRAPN